MNVVVIDFKKILYKVSFKNYIVFFLVKNRTARRVNFLTGLVG